MVKTSTEATQASYFNEIAQEYSAHYDDEYSTRYREQFFFERMFRGIDLRGLRVFDAMCGAGAVTQYALARGAEVTGLDISGQALRLYRERFPAAKAVEASLFDSRLPDASFDVVSVMGGLHHLQPEVSAAFTEVHRLLRPGGYFVFAEPPAGTFADLFRKVWYRVDRKNFEENEAAIPVDRLIEEQRHRFEPIAVSYGGGPAYFLIFNSLVLRVPLGVKRWIAEPLMRFDGAVERVLPRTLSSYVVAQFRKR